MARYTLPGLDDLPPLDEAVERVEWCYVKPERAYLVRTVNAAGYQVGEGEYVWGRKFAEARARELALQLRVPCAKVA